MMQKNNYSNLLILLGTYESNHIVYFFINKLVTINWLQLANDSSCKHCTSDCLLILSGSCFTCSKQYCKSCSKILILKFSL